MYMNKNTVLVGVVTLMLSSLAHAGLPVSADKGFVNAYKRHAKLFVQEFAEKSPEVMNAFAEFSARQQFILEQGKRTRKMNDREAMCYFPAVVSLKSEVATSRSAYSSWINTCAGLSLGRFKGDVRVYR